MHSNFLATVLIAISVANGIFAVPLGLSHAEATTDEEKANLASLQEANTEVNNQIPHMEKVLADPTNEKHKPLIEAAFGKDASLDLNKVKQNVQKLKTGTLPVDLKTAPGSQTIAYNRYDADHPPMNSVHVEFGKKYHKSATSTRAGTLIHEATHHLGNTGDYIENGQMLKGNQHETNEMGYTSKTSFYKTPKSLNGDKTWTTMRDSTKNMHDNAEAYGQFASLCANANLSRRDYHNFRRALATGDDDSAIAFLAKRNACALPKDYFKKKAAEKAAAAKKGAAEKKSTPGATKSKGPAAKTLAKSKIAPHAGKQSSMKKSPVAGKAATKKLPGGRTAKAVGKTAGSRRPTKKTKSPAAAAHGGKHAATPKSKAAGSTAAGKKKVAAAGKRVAKTTANKGALKSNTKRPTTKAAGGSKNRLTKVNASKRPTSKASGHATGNRVSKPKSAAAAKRPNTKKTTGVAKHTKAAGKKAVKTAAKSTANKAARPTTQKKSKSPATKSSSKKPAVHKAASKAGVTKAKVASSKSAPRKAAVKHAVAQKKTAVPKKAAATKKAAVPKKAAPVKHAVAQKKTAATKKATAPKKAAPAKHAATAQKKATAPKKATPKAAAKPKPVAKAAPKKAAAQPKAAAKAAAKPKPVVKAAAKTAPAKAAGGKKGRRDLEFESEFDM